MGCGGLSWIPKPFYEGDLDGGGQENILGRTNSVDSTEILVRETAQNSWDARLEHASAIDFEMHLRRATDAEREILGSEIFTQSSDFEHALPELRELLYSSDELWLLEISDRGTRGLGGPTSSRSATGPDENTDFRDFVLSLGAARNQKHGGGTYGFGKTASYRASRCGAMVIWSQCRTPEGVESRFIASALGKSFQKSGRRYTGRHWWAVNAREESFSPATGEESTRLGDSIFSRGFSSDETGTSLLIVAPDMADAAPKEFAQKLADAVLKHLWPKMCPEQGRTLMRMSVRLNNIPVPIQNPTTHPVISNFATALNAVRALSRGEQLPTPARTATVIGQPKGVGRTSLGYLAMIPFPHAKGKESRLLRDQGDVHDICLMRDDAELVVRYLPEQRHPVEGNSWAAVFKPALNFDDAFAEAEPPTHDDWSFESLTDPRTKSIVRVAMNKLREQIREWTYPTSVGTSVGEEVHPAAQIADALAGLLPAAKGSGPGPSPLPSRSGSTRQPHPTATVQEAIPSEPCGNVRDWVFRVALAAPDHATYEIDPTVAIATADQDDTDDPRLRILGWDVQGTEPDLRHPPQSQNRTLTVLNDEDTSLWLRVTAPAEFAVGISLAVKRVPGS